MIDPDELLVNIRETYKRFFIDKVIKGNKELEPQTRKRNVLMVLDDRTTKIVDRFLNVVDLLECGIIGLESLSKRRKRMPGFHVIYLIEPSEDSLRQLRADFAEADPKAAKKNDAPAGPLYDLIHIIFTSFVSEFDLQTLTQSKNLISAIASVQQANLDLLTLDDNIYSLDYPGEDKCFTNEITQKHDKLIEDLSNRMMSCLSLTDRCENLQIIYQKGGISEALAIECQKKSQKLLDDIYEATRPVADGPAIHFLILDRAADMLSPFLRDNTYCSMYYNLTPTHENTMKFEYEIEGKGVVEQVATLNEADTIWRNFRYTGFVNAMKTVSTSYQEFAKKNSSVSHKERASKSANELIDEIRAMPQYNEIVKDYSRHLNAMLKVVKNSKESNFKQVFELEQSIAVLKRRAGEDFDQKDIKVNLLPDADERIRIGLLCHYSLGWDFEKIGRLMELDNENKMKLKSIMTLFDRMVPEETTYRLQYDEEADQASPEYYKCPVVNIVKLLTTNRLFGPNKGQIDIKLGRSSLYPKGSPSQIFERNNFRQTGLNVDKDKMPYVIVFIVGGIFYNEIAKLTAVCNSGSFGNYKLICGGTGVYSPYSFLKKYNELNQERKAKAKKEREEKIRMMEEAERLAKEKDKNALFDVLKPKEEAENPDEGAA